MFGETCCGVEHRYGGRRIIIELLIYAYAEGGGYRYFRMTVTGVKLGFKFLVGISLVETSYACGAQWLDAATGECGAASAA